MKWLESGSDAEQELADRIYETFEIHLQPCVDPTASILSGELTLRIDWRMPSLTPH